jgi:hypothetical protein
MGESTMTSRNRAPHQVTNRRQFLGRVARNTALGVSASIAARTARAEKSNSARPAVDSAAKPKRGTVTDYLEQVVLKRRDIDCFLDADQPNWATFDAELGYVLRNSVRKDGLDGAHTIGRYDPRHGQRKMINFVDAPCRINTYGDSFTM